METGELTECELMRAIIQALEDCQSPEGALTTEAIFSGLRNTGHVVPIIRLRSILRTLKGQGRITPCRVVIERLDGTHAPVPAYRICVPRKLVV